MNNKPYTQLKWRSRVNPLFCAHTMLDISVNASTGVVDTLRFMGATGETTVHAPLGLLRQDVTLSGQLHEHRRRMEALEHLQHLIDEKRAELGLVASAPMIEGAVRDEGNDLEQPMSSATRDIAASIEHAKQGHNSLAASSTSPSSPPLAGGASSAGGSLGRETSPSSIQFHPEPLALKPTGVAPLAASLAATRSPDPNTAESGSPVFTYTDSTTTPSSPFGLSAASRHISTSMAPNLAVSLLRATLAQQERYLPCYFCAKDVLHAEFAAHLHQCAEATEALLRKMFLNPLRFYGPEHTPQAPIPPLSADEVEFDEYAMECSRCIGASLLDCPHCHRKFNVHELQTHTTRCIGKRGVASEVLHLSKSTAFVLS